jgi:hypothetical protein
MKALSAAFITKNNQNKSGLNTLKKWSYDHHMTIHMENENRNRNIYCLFFFFIKKVLF